MHIVEHGVCRVKTENHWKWETQTVGHDIWQGKSEKGGKWEMHTVWSGI
jgi:hypothetical protein